MSTLPIQTETNEPASAARVWHRLGAGIDAAHLPAPGSIVVRNRDHSATVYLDDADDDRTDLFTWICWLNAGQPIQVGHRQHSSGRWSGWEIEVVLIERAS